MMSIEAETCSNTEKNRSVMLDGERAIILTDCNFTYMGHQEKYWLHQRAESQLVILTSKNLRRKWLNLLGSPHRRWTGNVKAVQEYKQINLLTAISIKFLSCRKKVRKRNSSRESTTQKAKPPASASE